MKKILVLFLVLFLPLAAFAQEPLSQEVLDQAKLQAGLFLELKNALGLAWMDDYNAYLEDPVNSPQPAWATSVQDLINDSYLSGTFPTDFAITPTGQEVTISRTITSQAIKDVLPIYLPSVAISGDTVSLLVQRPEQWVAWEAGLLGKVSRDGSDDPDILPNSVLDFGEGSEIRFANNDGKISGVESLTYKGDELDDRFVNTSGDNMTGDLKINGYKVLHTGDYGHGNGINADLLDGQHGSFYQNASNLSAGIVPPDRLKGQTYEINILGNAATATNANYASSAGNADTVDGKHASDFALSGHTHGEYLNKTKPAGDTMVGPLGVNFESGITSGIGSHNIKGTGSTNVVGKGFKIDWDTDFGFVGLVDKGADRKDMVFANEQTGDNFVFMSQGIEIMALKPESKTLEIDGNKVWHAGNDGSGSGLDADLLDGKHISELSSMFGGLTPNGVKTYSSPGTYTWTKNPGTKYVFVQVVGGGGGGRGYSASGIPGTGGTGGTSSFGSYCYATGGGGGGSSNREGCGYNGDINKCGSSPIYYVEYSGNHRSYHVTSLGYSPFDYSVGRGGLPNSTSDWYAGYGGGYAAKFVDVSDVNSVTVTVGAGGAGGRGWGGYNGNPGTPGIVIVHEFK